MWLTASVIAQLLAVVALSVLVLSLARQVSILHARLLPAGQAGGLLTAGDVLEPTSLTTLDGHAQPLSANDGYALTALLFVSADCPLCRSLVPGFLRFNAPSARLLVASGDADAGGFAAHADALGIEPGSAAVAPELAGRLGLHELPALCAFGGDNELIVNKVIHAPRQLEHELAQLARPSGEKVT